ncbi:MAG: DUF4942 domain-containing protein [Planctomycetota bacterium]|jgi:predicted RNA methylase|nr:DUF4942 domain-containing protein [Planctomycetota bacterium]
MLYSADEFYPTPEQLIAEMLSGIDFDKAGTILEPSAGKGDIIKRIRAKGRGYGRAEPDIDAIEISPELRHILKGEGIRIVHDDFLTFQSLKKYDLVIMNPPFSNGDRHVLKALSLVRGGGRLVALLNAETLRNPCTNTRRELAAALAAMGARIVCKRNAFADAERKTGVEIALITATAPEPERESVILDWLRRAAEQEPPQEHSADNPLAVNDKIKALVEQYEHEARAGVFLIDEYLGVSRFMLTTEHDKSPLLELSVSADGCTAHTCPQRAKNAFLENLRLRYWRALFDTGEFSRRLTSNVLSDLHSRIAEFSRYEFSLFNIYELHTELGNSIIDNIKDTIVKLFDEFTARHSWAEYSGNVLHYNGWKTNDAFKINKKVIIPLHGCFDRWHSGSGFKFGYTVARKLRDIEKTFDYLAGTLHDDHGQIEEILKAAGENGQRRNVAFKHFSASFFKKGTCHLVFNDADLVKKINIFAGQKKNWLPPGYGTTAYGDLEPEAWEAVKSFDGGEVGYTHTVANKEYFLFKPESTLLRLAHAATPA